MSINPTRIHFSHSFFFFFFLVLFLFPSVRIARVHFSFFSSPSSAFILDCPRAHVNTFGKRGLVLFSTVVLFIQRTQRQNVTAGDSQDGQFGEFLVTRVGRHCLSKVLESSTDCVNSSAFSSIGFDSPLSSHVLVIALLLLRAHIAGSCCCCCCCHQ